MTYQNEKKDEKIKFLENEIVSLKNIIDSKEAQITTYKSVNDKIYSSAPYSIVTALVSMSATFKC